MIKYILNLFRRQKLPPGYMYKRYRVETPDSRRETTELKVELLGMPFMWPPKSKLFFGKYHVPLAIEPAEEVLFITGEHGYYIGRDIAELKNQSKIVLLPGGNIKVSCYHHNQKPIDCSLELENFELIDGIFFPELNGETDNCEYRQRPPGNFILEVTFPIQHGCSMIRLKHWGKLHAGETLTLELNKDMVFHEIADRLPSDLVVGQKLLLAVRSQPDISLPSVYNWVVMPKLIPSVAVEQRVKDQFEEYCFQDYPVPDDGVLRFFAGKNCRYLLVFAQDVYPPRLLFWIDLGELSKS